MKSYIDKFTVLYDALARDIDAQYPTIRAETERDLSRLRRGLTHEGLSFITITHLELNTFFQKALARGELDFDLPQMSRPRGYGRKSQSDSRPSYMHGLLSMIFHEDGKLRNDPDVTAIAFVRQWLLMAKKLEVDCDESRKEAALLDFLAIEARLPDHHPDRKSVV